ncbi:MAG TPA: hypothetical protein VFK38_01495 [Candidatus Limnocylindrales bacterium]|nr:hypothetical protein [Candidatus Limnocylindrales bacterium]
MIPLLSAVVGCALLVAGALLLARLGTAFRVARLLQAAPAVDVAEAVRLARTGESRYVRVRGRISSEEEFPDEHDRPLVFRRRRLEVADGPGWRTIEDERLAVPFGVEDRGAFIAVHVEALDEGLVVLGGESTGTAGEVPERMPPGTAGTAPVRHRIEQVSAVEHAHVVGVPRLIDEGPAMSEGLGRPLIVSTLDLPDAMRVLAGGRRGRVAAAAGLLVAGSAALALALALAVTSLAAPAAVLAATPSPTAVATATPTATPVPTVVGGGDTRSEGEGAGLVGTPLLALGAVILLGVLAAGAATAYARLTRAD